MAAWGWWWSVGYRGGYLTYPTASLLPPGRVGEDMFPPLLPPTEQDLTKLILEGQAESGREPLGAQPLPQPSSYGQSVISMSHLDLRPNPSW